MLRILNTLSDSSVNLLLLNPSLNIGNNIPYNKMLSPGLNNPTNVSNNIIIIEVTSVTDELGPLPQ